MIFELIEFATWKYLSEPHPHVQQDQPHSRMVIVFIRDCNANLTSPSHANDTVSGYVSSSVQLKTLWHVPTPVEPSPPVIYSYGNETAAAGGASSTATMRSAREKETHLANRVPNFSSPALSSPGLLQ